MNVNPNPYPHGRWTPGAASSVDPAPRLIPPRTGESLERADVHRNLYDKYWGALESSLRAENEELIRLVLPAFAAA